MIELNIGLLCKNVFVGIRKSVATLLRGNETVLNQTLTKKGSNTWKSPTNLDDRQRVFFLNFMHNIGLCCHCCL